MVDNGGFAAAARQVLLHCAVALGGTERAQRAQRSHRQSDASALLSPDRDARDDVVRHDAWIAVQNCAALMLNCSMDCTSHRTASM